MERNKLTLEKISLSSVISLAVPYLIVCGGLYQIGYWFVFRINGLAFVSLVEIAKSSVAQFGSAFLAIVIYTIFFILFSGKNDKVAKDEFEEKNFSVFGWIWFGSSFLLLFLSSTIRFQIFGLVCIYSLPLALSKSDFLKRTISDFKHRIFALLVFVSVPVYAFVSGLAKGHTIKENFSFEYVVSKDLNRRVAKQYPNVYTSDTFKILGFAEEYIILTDLNNWRKVYVRKDNIDTIITRRGRIYNNKFVSLDDR